MLRLHCLSSDIILLNPSTDGELDCWSHTRKGRNMQASLGSVWVQYLLFLYVEMTLWCQSVTVASVMFNLLPKLMHHIIWSRAVTNKIILGLALVKPIFWLVTLSNHRTHKRHVQRKGFYCSWPWCHRRSWSDVPTIYRWSVAYLSWLVCYCDMELQYYCTSSYIRCKSTAS